MYKISKEFHFSASHQLKGLHKDHPCSRLHGHNYVIIIELKGELDDIGFVKDYRELEPIKNWLDYSFDHKHLNEVCHFNPTAENLAKYIYDTWCDKYNISKVSVKETDKTIASYEI